MRLPVQLPVTITCPHSHVACSIKWEERYISAEAGKQVWLRNTRCPACERAIVFLDYGLVVHSTGGDPETTTVEEIQLWPKTSSRRPLPPDVPESYAREYYEGEVRNGRPGQKKNVSRY